MSDGDLKLIEEMGCRVVESEHQYYVGCGSDDEEHVTRLRFILGDLKAFISGKGADAESAEVVCKKWVELARGLFIKECVKLRDPEETTEELAGKEAEKTFDKLFKSRLRFYK